MHHDMLLKTYLNQFVVSGNFKDAVKKHKAAGTQQFISKADLVKIYTTCPESVINLRDKTPVAILPEPDWPVEIITEDDPDVDGGHDAEIKKEPNTVEESM